MYVAMGMIHGMAMFNRKFNTLVQGRKHLFSRLKADLQRQEGPIIWVHCASLGEFEQGRSIIDQLTHELPQYRILLTFFSPSGYEQCKSYEGVSVVSYIPWDIPSQVKQFVSIVNPKLVLFIRYEFWPNLIYEVQKRNIPLVLVSALFRKNQLFFKRYGGFFRALLQGYNHFFVQDAKSQQLLYDIGIDRVTVAGDSRIDRVYQLAQQHDPIPLAKTFMGKGEVFIAGSCWPEDINVLIPFINSYKDTLKFIIAPHEINESFLSAIEHKLSVTSIRYSKTGGDAESARVLLIDNIGLLSRLYKYGKFAYVGGGFGKGLHNILEAACYGMPIFFGNKNYRKFKEANDLIIKGGAFAIKDHDELVRRYEALNYPSEKYTVAAATAQAYVQENKGATNKVVTHCKQLMTEV